MFANRDGLWARIRAYAGTARTIGGARLDSQQCKQDGSSTSYSRSYRRGEAQGPANTQGFNFYPTFISPNAQLTPAVTLQEGYR